MGEPRTQGKDRKELLGDLNEALGIDYPAIPELERMNADFIAYANMMGVRPLTLLFMTNRLKEMAREAVFYEYLDQHGGDAGEPSEEEIEALQKEFERMCEIIQEEGKKTLMIKHEMMSWNVEEKRSVVEADSAQAGAKKSSCHS
jgi:hypothetical protein